MFKNILFTFYTILYSDWYPIKHDTICNLTIYSKDNIYKNIESIVDPFYRYSKINIFNISLLFKQNSMLSDFEKIYNQAKINKNKIILFFIQKESISPILKKSYEDEENFKNIIPLIILDKSLSSYYTHNLYVQALNGKLPIIIVDYTKLLIFLNKNNVYVSLYYSKTISANKVALYLSIILMIFINLISLSWGLLFYKTPRRYKIEIHSIILFLLILKCILSYLNTFYVYKKKIEFDEMNDFLSEKIFHVIILIINYITKVVIAFISFIETDSEYNAELEEREIKSNAGNLVILFLFLVGAAEGNDFNEMDMSLILFSFYYFCIGIYVTYHGNKLRKALISTIEFIEIRNPERLISLKYKIKLLYYHIITLDSFIVFYLISVIIINKFLYEYVNLFVVQILNCNFDIFQYIGLMFTYLPRKLPRYAIFNLLFFFDDEYQFLEEDDYYEYYYANLSNEDNYLTKDKLKKVKNNIDGYSIFVITNPFFKKKTNKKELEMENLKIGLYFNESY